METAQTETTDLTGLALELLIAKIDGTLADIGERNVVEASKMIDSLLDMRIMALSLKDQQ